tara:strand:- start:9073 stop:10095 length:1023 start_codon:yes stop_codon:yes gene_type:complete
MSKTRKYKNRTVLKKTKQLTKRKKANPSQNKKKPMKGGNNIKQLNSINILTNPKEDISKRRKCSNFDTPKPTCYNMKQLEDLAKNWNTKNPNNKITIPPKDAEVEVWKNNLWNELKKRHGHGNEDKWIKIYDDAFAPEVPLDWEKDKNTWLSEDDIYDVMRNHVKHFNDFHFLDPAPIDFDEKTKSGACKFSGLCKYKYKDLADKYNNFGAIFNTDVHSGDGEHWIALFIKLKEGEISYFDSVGAKPPKEIKILIDRFEKEGNDYFKDNKINKTVKINVNKTKHQLGNTECGVYCLAFLHHMLTDGNFNIFSEQRISDENMTQWRAFFFDDRKGIYDNNK